MGMRVEAVWKPDGERTGSFDDMLYFRPTGEPDAPPESYITGCETSQRHGARRPSSLCVSSCGEKGFHDSASQRCRRRLRAGADRRARRAPHGDGDALPGGARGAGAVRRRARRDRLPDRRLGRLHRRPAVRLRRRARRDGHLAAAAGLAPRDGCRLRRLLRLDPHAGRRVRHGDGGRLRQGLGRASRSACSTCSSIPTTWRRSASARSRTSALQASAYMARSGATDRDLAEIAARNRAAGGAQPERAAARGGDAPTSCSDAVGGRAAAPGLRAADRRERGVPDARRRGQGREDVQAAGVDPRRRSARRDAEPRRARSDAAAPAPSWRREKALAMAGLRQRRGGRRRRDAGRRRRPRR